MKKSVEVKRVLVNNYYNNTSKHVFQDVVDDVNKNNFYKVSLLKKKDSDEEFAYSVEIVDDSVDIFIRKINESYKAEHSVSWFPTNHKRKAITQFKELRDVMEILEAHIQAVIDNEEIKYGYKRINFKFSEKFNKVLSLNKKEDVILDK